MKWPKREGRSWTPWTVKGGIGLWSKDVPQSPPCDPVTCSECPGGDRCCKYTTPPQHPAGQSTHVTYDDDGYPARRRR